MQSSAVHYYAAQDMRTSNMATTELCCQKPILPTLSPPLPLSTSPSCSPSGPVKLYSALITCTALPPSFIPSPTLLPFFPSLSLSLSAAETLLWAKFSTGVIQYSSLHFPHLSPSLSPSVYLSMPHHIPQFLQSVWLSPFVLQVVPQGLME